MFALSKIVRPASRQTSTRRVASAAPTVPQCLKNSLPPPNVPVPSVRTGTAKPDPPSCLYSMSLLRDFLRLIVLRPLGQDRLHGRRRFGVRVRLQKQPQLDRGCLEEPMARLDGAEDVIDDGKPAGRGALLHLERGLFGGVEIAELKIC